MVGMRLKEWLKHEDLGTDLSAYVIWKGEDGIKGSFVIGTCGSCKYYKLTNPVYDNDAGECQNEDILIAGGLALLRMHPKFGCIDWEEKA